VDVPCGVFAGFHLLAGVLIGLCGSGTPPARGLGRGCFRDAWCPGCSKDSSKGLELMVSSQFCLSVEVAKE
jgi:hypothetical protein